MPWILVAVFALVSSSGCGAVSSSTPPDPQNSAPAYRPVVDVKQTMEWILDPAADVIWDSAGWIITAEGETDLAPTTEEGWKQVRNGAAVVAETGNLLMMPGRAAGPDWIAYAQGLTAAGEVAMAAAEARDAEALFDAGGQLYQVCRACHDRYLLPLEEGRSSQ
jgi:uncharacterized protein YceK